MCKWYDGYSILLKIENINPSNMNLLYLNAKINIIYAKDYSLMVDFRCIIVPRFVYADGEFFDYTNLP